MNTKKSDTNTSVCTSRKDNIIDEITQLCPHVRQANQSETKQSTARQLPPHARQVKRNKAKQSKTTLNKDKRCKGVHTHVKRSNAKQSIALEASTSVCTSNTAARHSYVKTRKTKRSKAKQCDINTQVCASSKAKQICAKRNTANIGYRSAPVCTSNKAKT